MSWIAVAFVAPALWALVALLDTYFIDGIYRDATDGAIISGLFQGFPWVLVPLGLIDFDYPGHPIAVYAIASGSLFLISFLAYFRALFISNDGALMQILWNLSILVVPFMTWLLMDEILATGHYLGIVLAFVGLGAFLSDARMRTHDGRLIVVTMFGAITALSGSMVLSKQAYNLVAIVPAGSGSPSFASVFLLYCLGAALVAFALIAVRCVTRGAISALGFSAIGRRYVFIFAFAESLSLGGSLASQRAIDLAPSVSYVAVIESLVPVFIMIFSMAAAWLLSLSGNKRLATTYLVQFSNPARKVAALCAIASGIYIIT